MARVDGMSELEGNKATAVFGRLRKRKEIDRVYAVGVRIRGASILLAAAPGLVNGETRLALAVGKKYHKSAVTRNRLKRIFRAASKQCGWTGPALDIVLSPLKPGVPYRQESSGQEILELLKKGAHKLHP